MDTLNFIPGAELVTRIFGCWPTFQNAEIQWIRLNNAKVGNFVSPSIELVLRYWEMTSDISPRGYYLQSNNTLIHFVFREVDHVHLYDFNHRNVILRLSIVSLSEPQSRPKYKVQIKSSVGLGASFVSRCARVLSIQPCDEEGNPCGKKSESESEKCLSHAT